MDPQLRLASPDARSQLSCEPLETTDPGISLDTQFSGIIP
jgi:hypothetical protein